MTSAPPNSIWPGDGDDHAERLSPQAAAALDRLIDAGWEPHETDDEALAIRGLLEGVESGGIEPTPLLIERTIASLRTRGVGVESDSPALCADDAEALDALAMAGFVATDTPKPLRKRALRLEALGALLTTTSHEPAESDLVERTLSRIRAEQSVPAVAGRISGRGFRWNDLAAIAAMVVIGASMILPTMSASRDASMREVCAAGLMASSRGFASYAFSNDDRLPMANEGRPGFVWWNVGDAPRSNSANLFALARSGHSTLHDLACPTNAMAPQVMTGAMGQDWRRHEEVSYSYRIMFASQRPTLSDERFVVVTDRSPVISRALAGVPINPLENSPNHLRAGQNVMFSDGVIEWRTSPVLAEKGDNLWLPRAIEMAIDRVAVRRGLPPLHGSETPASLDDDFVGP